MRGAKQVGPPFLTALWVEGKFGMGARGLGKCACPRAGSQRSLTQIFKAAMDANNPYSPPQAELGTMPPIEGEILASRWKRFCGAFADGLVMGIVGFVLGLLFYFKGGESTLEKISQLRTMTLGQALVVSVIQLGVWLALNGYLVHTQGQTIGKLMVGTRIVRRDGSPVTLGRVFLFRLLPMVILGAIPIVGLVKIVDILLIFRSNKACLHDDIADTKVVLADPRTA